VIEFLLKGNNSAADIYEQLYCVCVCVRMCACMNAISVRRWAKHFKNGNTNIADQPCCVQLKSATVEHSEQKIDMIIKDGWENWHDHQRWLKSRREISVQLELQPCAVQEMIATLGYQKVCSHWVPSHYRWTQKMLILVSWLVKASSTILTQ